MFYVAGIYLKIREHSLDGFFFLRGGLARFLLFSYMINIIGQFNQF